MAIVIAESTPFETLLHYGLFLGAIFQIVCIMAVVFIPESKIEKDEDEQMNQVPGNQKHGDSSRRGRKEKKKYR